MESEVRKILTSASDAILSNLIIKSYQEVERNYFLKSWKTSELDAGHFVESVRRFIEFQLFSKYTPVEKSLQPFNDKTMLKYMNSQGSDSYRIHIPRILLTIYGIRNKRGVGHISSVTPNHLDATFILSSTKWILAEIIRINSTYSAQETSRIVEHIVDRTTEGVWEQGEITRILVDGLNIKEQIIFLLFSTELKTAEQLRKVIEYKNISYFKKVLKQLHSSRLIEYDEDGRCTISPKGLLVAEEIILNKIKA